MRKSNKRPVLLKLSSEDLGGDRDKTSGEIELMGSLKDITESFYFLAGGVAQMLEVSLEDLFKACLTKALRDKDEDKLPTYQMDNLSKMN